MFWLIFILCTYINWSESHYKFLALLSALLIPLSVVHFYRPLFKKFHSETKDNLEKALNHC